MMLRCVCSQFDILGWNSQILCRNRKKLDVFVYALVKKLYSSGSQSY